MAAPRSPLAELGRLLASLAGPVYVIDARRRIIFANDALAAWTGVAVEQLVGRVCYFCADTELPPREALAAALGPPPAVLDGARATVQLHISTAENVSARWCQFVPLRDHAGQLEAVLALVDPWENEPAGEPSEVAPERVPTADPESPAALHDWLSKFQAAQRRRYRLASLAGNSPAMRRVRAQLELAASSRANVVLIGPSGSGRAHAARVIFQLGRNEALEPTATLPCRSLSAELLRATWASLSASLAHARPQRATLLLLDLEQLPAEAQAELAARLTDAPLSIRILGTSHAPLEPLAARGEFRSDIAATLSTLAIEIPALVERSADLPLLAQAIVEQRNADGDKQLAGVAPEVIDLLALYAWPENVGQLAEVLGEAHRAAHGPLVQVRDLPRWFRLATEAQPATSPRAEPPIVLDDFLRRVERELIERALRQAKGNKSRAAKLLGTTRPRLYRRMVQVGLVTE